MNNKLHQLSLAEVAFLFRRRELSPVEVTKACLDHIENTNKKVNAFISVTAEKALQEAYQAECRFENREDVGLLCGIPIAYKDMIDIAGLPTTAHSRVMEGYIAAEDAEVVKSLKRQGSVSLGKLSLWEFAGGVPTLDAPYPFARNPWNTDYNPGGSSSGCGVAVSAGMCYGAVGTDSGGSIRNPASNCSVVGFKPSGGAFDLTGVIPYAPSLDHIGPMTRTVLDNCLLLLGMSSTDVFGVGPVVAGYQSGNHIERGFSAVKGVRVGVPREYLTATADKKVLACFQKAIDHLVEIGANIYEFDFPSLYESSEAAARIIMSEAYEYHKSNLKSIPEKYGKPFYRRILAAEQLSGEDLDAAYRTRNLVKREFENILDRVDIVASPGATHFPNTLDSLLSPSYIHTVEGYRAYNLTGMPAMTLPMDFSSEGLPVGLQLAARKGNDRLIYQVAFAFEAKTGCTTKHSPLCHSG